MDECFLLLRKVNRVFLQRFFCQGSIGNVVEVIWVQFCCNTCTSWTLGWPMWQSVWRGVVREKAF